MQRIGRVTLRIVEISILSVLILAPRCANYQEVFVGGNVYFTDADCYARMMRVRLCAEHPGLIVRHHKFENFPNGTTPHTTAPLDYLILALSKVLKPFVASARQLPVRLGPVAPYHLDLAGAFISPLLALVGGWFLWWWSRRMQFRYRWALLTLYAISPILVHGSELGRPDHQSLLILLLSIALCAEWELRSKQSERWSAVSGINWGLALWVSLYEPLVLLLLVLACRAVAQRRRMLGALHDRQLFFGKHRRIGWILFAVTIVVALLIEQRIPAMSIFSLNEIFKNWSRTIGELSHVSPANPIWLRWCGYLLLVVPFLVWFGIRKSQRGAPSPPSPWTGSAVASGRALPTFVLLLMVATYGLTIWQARWAYFFVLIFALAIPALLELIKSRTAVWIAFTLSILPILRDWDERIWPGEAEIARRIEQRNEAVQLRELAITLQSPEMRPFLAPWWLSPPIAYWSGQPGVAGSSHESLDGIAETARFFASEDWRTAGTILEKHEVSWVFAYDSERVAQNSSAILGLPILRHALCFVLDRTPAQVPQFLIFSAQNGTAKLYRVGNKL